MSAIIPSPEVDIEVKWMAIEATQAWVASVLVDDKARLDMGARVQAIPATSWFLLDMGWQQVVPEGPVHSRFQLLGPDPRILMHMANLWIVQIVCGHVVLGPPPTEFEDVPGLIQEVEKFLEDQTQHRKETKHGR